MQTVRGPVRLAVGAGAGLAAAALVAVTVGLPTGRPVGAEDNGDGYRLYCDTAGTGLLPRTVDRLASWKGGVVTDFTVGAPSCGMSVPSSAELVLRAAALGPGTGGTLTLGTVAWWYAALVGLVVAVAAWAASASGPRRAAVLIAPVAPLALASFSRFFVSTYAEPTGLLGALAVACGVAVLLATDRAQHRARLTALVLTGLGGVLAATAKVAYLPVLAVALVVVVVVALREGRSRLRTAGVLALVVAAVAVPVGGAVHFQDQVYAGANVHDVVFTLALVELGPDAPAELGLPPEAAAAAGTGFFNGPPRPTADWYVRAVGEQAGATRAAALSALARDPAASLRAVGVGLQATLRADLPYLAAGPADVTRLSPPSGDPGWSGARQPDLRTVLDASRRPPWIPTALVLLALVAAASTPAWRRRAPAAARWCLAAGLSAVTALGLVVVAVFGDGYFEVFKHVWLASYLLAVGALCLGAAVVTGARSLTVLTTSRAGPPRRGSAPPRGTGPRWGRRRAPDRGAAPAAP